MSVVGAAGDLMRGIFERLGNPILIVDMKSRLRRPRFIIAYTATMVLVALVVIVTSVVVDSVDAEAATIGKILFLTTLGVMSAVLLLIFPAFSCNAITEERLKKSFDLLITTDLSAWRIVMGKLLSCLLYCGLFIVGTLPVVSVAFLYGGVSISMILISYYDFMAFAAVVSAFGIMCSAASKNSNILAIIRTYAGLIPFSFAVIFPLHYVTVSVLISFEIVPLPAPDAFFAGAATSTKALLLLLHPVGCSMLIVQFLCFSVTRLSPPNLNASRRMRACLLMWLGAGLLFLVGIPLCEGDMLDFTEPWWVVVLVYMMTIGMIAVFVFSSELRGLSRRLRRDLGRLQGVSRLGAWFYPGGDTGLPFALVATGLSLLLGIGLLALRLRLPRQGFVEPFLATTGFLLVFLFFAGAMTRLMCELIATRVAALIVVLVLALVSVVPPVLELSTDDARLSFMSPYDVMYGLWSSTDKIRHPTSALLWFGRDDLRQIERRWEQIETPRLLREYPAASPGFIAKHKPAFMQAEFAQWPRTHWAALLLYGSLGVLFVFVDRLLGRADG